MKKYLIFISLILTFCIPCYGQEEIPSNRIIRPQEILNTLNQVKSNPTSMDTFDKRLKIVDVWIMLLIRSGKIDEVSKTAPPDTIPKIYELKLAGENDAAYQKLDELYLELEKIGLPLIPEIINPPSNTMVPMSVQSDTSIDKESVNATPHGLAGEEASGVKKIPKTKQTKEIIIDFNAVEGEISPYIFGVSLGPDCDEKEKVLLKEANFKLLGIGLPLNDNRAGSYTIDDLNRDLRIVIDVGATPLFTLAPGAKPSDKRQYFSQLKNVVIYINNEWVKKYPNREWLFRFGNEPDDPEFWRGSQEDFFEMYAIWAKTIKEINPKFIVGGPALQLSCTREGNTINCSKLSPWLTNFLRYLEKEKVPLDFFSFHAYSPHIYMSFNQQPKAVYSELAKHPKISPLFGTPKLANDEWNITLGKPWFGVYNPVFDQAWTAAHNVCALINMLNEGLWLSTRHGGICRAKSNEQMQKLLPPQKTRPPGEEADKGMEDFLLVTKDGLPKPVYYAFKGINKLSYTPIKIKITGNDGINFAAIAGKSKDGSKVTIVLVNYDSGKVQKLLKGPPIAEDEYKHILRKLSISGFTTFEAYKLLFKNISWSSKDKVVMKRYVVSDTDNLREVENTILTNIEDKIELYRDIVPPSVHIITFEKQK